MRCRRWQTCCPSNSWRCSSRPDRRRCSPTPRLRPQPLPRRFCVVQDCLRGAQCGLHRCYALCRVLIGIDCLGFPDQCFQSILIRDQAQGGDRRCQIFCCGIHRIPALHLHLPARSLLRPGRSQSSSMPRSGCTDPHLQQCCRPGDQRFQLGDVCAVDQAIDGVIQRIHRCGDVRFQDFFIVQQSSAAAYASSSAFRLSGVNRSRLMDSAISIGSPAGSCRLPQSSDNAARRSGRSMRC